MEFWTKAALGAVAVAAIVILAGVAVSSYNDKIAVEYSISSVSQTDSSSSVNDSLKPDGYIWVYAKFKVVTEREEPGGLPVLLADGDGDGVAEEYESLCTDIETKTYGISQSVIWTFYYAVPAIYLDGELVEDKDVASAVSFTFPSSWTASS